MLLLTLNLGAPAVVQFFNWDKYRHDARKRALAGVKLEAAKVIEEEAQKVALETKAQTDAQAEANARESLQVMRDELERKGIAYKKAYKEIYLQLFAEMRQQEEDDGIAQIFAMLM